MRIDGNRRTGALGRSRGVAWHDSATGSFSVPEEAPAGRATATAASIAIGGVESLLALQALDQPSDRAVRLEHGRAMLDLLDGLKLDILSGSVSASRLEGLVERIARRPSRHPDERVEAVLDEIELRARVELAKLGRVAA
jgi:hypothetical protein